VLYISYDGVLEPLGESQVVAYIERLAARVAITLLSFEKPPDLADRGRVAAMEDRLARAGITWMRRRYHKRPPVLSTLLDVAAGRRAARAWAGGGGELLAHARGYVPALVARYAKRRFGARFVFDMRGFWVDEKVEAGHWTPNGLLYRVGKWCERRFLADADAVVSLTEAGVRELPALGRVRADAPVVVIPTCADLDRFSPGPRDDARRTALGLAGAFVVGYAGTMSNWYLRRETLAFFACLARQIRTMKALIVTRDDHDRLKADAAAAGLPADRLVLLRAGFDEMPGLMRLMDVGVFFIRVCFSKRASAATKLAEFLGCGVPVVINDGIGDSGELVRGARAGLVLDDLSEASYPRALEALRRLADDPDAGARCRAAAERFFSLDGGVARYAALYDSLFAAPAAAEVTR
jgi:glycosyltransferase involved in cell wall biosynthesis